MPFIAVDFDGGATLALTGENAGSWVEGSPTHERIAPPASDDEREALWDVADDFLDKANIEDLNPPSLTELFADLVVAHGFRRPSPVTREALAKHLSRVACDWTHNDCGSDDHDQEHTNWKAYLSEADALLSRFSLPEPAEAEWEYGVEYVNPDSNETAVYFYPDRPSPIRHYADGEHFLDWDNERSKKTFPTMKQVRRTSAGPWVPVEKGVEQ
jgi:hypothetical protein